MLYNLYASIIVLYKLFWTKDIAREQRAYPLWKFAVLGLSDGLADFLSSVGGVATPGGLQVLLSQLAIPLTLALSAALLRTRYKTHEVVGAVFILAGVVLAIVPALLPKHTLPAPATTHASALKWYSVAIFAASTIPQSASVILKEYAFREGALDVVYLSCLVSCASRSNLVNCPHF